MWEHVMSHLEQDPLKLTTEVDWVIKYNLIESYRRVVRCRSRTRACKPLPTSRTTTSVSGHDRSSPPRTAIKRERIVTDEEINEAMNTPPQTTRARLRGAFIKRAKERKRDYTVDWVHLKLNDQAQRTVLVQGPVQVA